MQSNLFAGNILKGIEKRISNAIKNEDNKAGLNWLKVKYLKHLPAGKVRIFNYKNKRIFYANAIELLHTLREIFVKEIYKTALPSTPVIIDCGSNIGLSVIYFKEKYPAAEIIAFEPDEANFDLLKKNVESFCFSNVMLKKEAVWIENTELSFSGEGTMGSKIGEEAGLHTKKVKASRLKDYLTRKIDFLKIDIEGAEFAVLKDIEDKLYLIENMFFEYHGKFDQNQQLTEIFDIITRTGFNYYIKEAADIYESPFIAAREKHHFEYDVQLNIFCFRSAK